MERKNRLFRRLETARRVIPGLPLTPRARVPEPVGTAALPLPARLTVATGRQAEAIAGRYLPAYVVVDAQYDILHFSGRTGRYLEPSAGTASLNLLNLVHRDLRLDLRTALHRATAEARRVELPRLVIHDEDRSHALNLIVEPVGGPGVAPMVVLFPDIGSVPDADGFARDRLGTDEPVQRHEAQLCSPRHRPPCHMEQLGSTTQAPNTSNHAPN